MLTARGLRSLAVCGSLFPLKITQQAQVLTVRLGVRWRLLIGLCFEIGDAIE